MADAIQPRLVRVLVIEDNPHVAELIREGLHGAARRELGGKINFVFEGVVDGQAGLQRITDEEFDLVICDVYMPVMDGATFLTRMRQKQAGKHTPVIALSAGGPRARESALAAGADVFLDKPIRLNELLAQVTKILS